MPGDEEDGWGQPTPIRQIIVSAACCSWWSGDVDDAGIPMAYQGGGAPRGYMVFNFRQNTYIDEYKATGECKNRQMNISFMTPSFQGWYDQLWDWVNIDPAIRSPSPPVTINDLNSPNLLAKSDLDSTILVANVWNGSRDSIVKCKIDNRKPITLMRDSEYPDPYAFRLHAYVYRYAAGFELWTGAQYGPADPQPLDPWLHARRSTHVCKAAIPTDLEVGMHKIGRAHV